MTFEEFVTTVGRQVRAGLVAANGAQAGADAAAEAMAYAWEHWDRVVAMDNPAGYLYRVGQTAARRSRRQGSNDRLFPAPELTDVEIEPGLLPALDRLSEMQRVCVVLVHGYGYGPTEAAETLDISASSVRTHLDRGMRTLRDQLEVTHEHR